METQHHNLLISQANIALQTKTLLEAQRIFGSLADFGQPDGNLLPIKGTDYSLVFEGEYFQLARGKMKSSKLISSLEDLGLAIRDVDRMHGEADCLAQMFAGLNP